MIIIYHAANSLDANMIKSLLEQYDVRAFIQGEYLQGGMGQLPTADLVTVSVENKHQLTAKKIIAEWDAGAIADEESTTNPLDDGLNAVV